MRHSTAPVEEQQSQTIREPLLDTPVAFAEDVRCVEREGARVRDGFSAAFQVCLPYRGIFVWHVGSDDIVGDANQVLFVSRGEPFRLTQPVPRGYAELIITPSEETLADVTDTPPARLSSHPLFRRRSHRADPSLQRLRTRLLHRLEAGVADPLRSEEAIVELLRGAFHANGNGRLAHARTQRLIARAKTYLEENLSTPVHLHEVARAAGASPAYLTDAFRRHEGIPLHRYLVQLRLSRALVELPHANDLTSLALDLGFSSHSHFTAAFRRMFQCTPSAFRESTRRLTPRSVL
jgi:AraC-like DNA-binding protein